MIEVALNFKNEFEGELKTANGSVPIGTGENSFTPYELLSGALGSCLYSTFLDIIKKMRLSYDTCRLEIQIEKRTEAPTTAKLVVIKCILIGGEQDKETNYKRAFTLATKNCSIFTTLSHVAEMKWSLEFKYIDSF